MGEAVALVRYGRRSAPPVEIEHADNENERATDRSENWRGHRRCAKEGRRNDVLDLWTAWHGVHGERVRAERVGRRDEALGNVGLAKQLGGERIHGERDDDHRHAAVDHQRADHHDAEHRAVTSGEMADAGGDRLGETGDLDQLAEERAEHEHRKVVPEERGHAVHEQRAVDRQHRARHRHGDRAKSRQRREEDDAVAAIRHEDEKGEGDERDDDAHGWPMILAVR